MHSLAQRRTATTITAAVIAVPLMAALAWLTLSPHRIEQRQPGAIRALLDWVGQTFGAWWGTLGVADVVANILVFVPIGILAYLIIPRRAWMAALIVGPAISAGIELFQLLFLPGRDATITDVAAASIGATIGVGLAAVATVFSSRRRT